MTVPIVPKMTQNDPSVPKKAALYTNNTLSVPTGVPNANCTKVHQMYQNSLGIMPRVLNTDPILSVPNATGVPNCRKWPQIIPVCQRATCVPTKTLSVPNGVPNVKCAKVHQVYQNSLEMMHSVLNTDPILSVPKCNWCTKHNDCTNRTQNDQEWSKFALIRFRDFYMGL